MTTQKHRHSLDDIIDHASVVKLWTLPGKKPPCRSTLWRYQQNGHIPKPKRISGANFYQKSQVIRLRNAYWGLD